MESSYSSEARRGSPGTWRPLGHAAGVAARVTAEKGTPLRLRFLAPMLKHEAVANATFWGVGVVLCSDRRLKVGS